MSTIAFAAYLQYGHAAMFYCYCYGYSTDLSNLEKKTSREAIAYFMNTRFFFTVVCWVTWPLTVATKLEVTLF